MVLRMTIVIFLHGSGVRMAIFLTMLVGLMAIQVVHVVVFGRRSVVK